MCEHHKDRRLGEQGKAITSLAHSQGRGLRAQGHFTDLGCNIFQKGFYSMRILIDHGQYDHLNLGDIAMLQSCISRLHYEWPDAEFVVLTNSPSLLRQYCPAAAGVRLAYADIPVINLVPRPIRARLERASQIIALHVRSRGSARSQRSTGPRSVLQAVREADLVVASGGGYINDVFPANAAGVLRVLQLAQSLGKHTAMFGQGLGPITRQSLRKRASAVFPKLTALGLREDRIGANLAISLGAAPDIVSLTGDDALEDIVNRECADGDAIGVNIRVADYAGVDPVNAEIISNLLIKSAVEYGVPIIGLPVSRQPADSDVNAIQELSRRTGEQIEFLLSDLDSPVDLAAFASRCRIVVTGSYHAAVFALAQGIPAICLTKSVYYDGKFSGLKSLFPEACFVVSLSADDFVSHLRSAIDDAWQLPIPTRSATRESALAQRTAGRKVYREFREKVENSRMRSGAVLAGS